MRPTSTYATRVCKVKAKGSLCKQALPVCDNWGRRESREIPTFVPSVSGNKSAHAPCNLPATDKSLLLPSSVPSSHNELLSAVPQIIIIFAVNHFLHLSFSRCQRDVENTQRKQNTMKRKTTNCLCLFLKFRLASVQPPPWNWLMMIWFWWCIASHRRCWYCCTGSHTGTRWREMMISRYVRLIGEGREGKAQHLRT